MTARSSRQQELRPSTSCYISCCLAADSEEDEAETPKTEKETVWDWELLNDNKAIWLRSPSDVSEDEYNKFFKAVSKASFTHWSIWHDVMFGGGDYRNCSWCC